MSQHDKQRTAEQSAAALYATDRASQAFGMRIVSIAPQMAVVSMTVRDEMTNGHGMCHGGVVFMLADSAFAFACNSAGHPTVAAAAAIDFFAAARLGDELTATATEVWQGGRSGVYDVVVTNQKAERIALFRGRSHRLSRAPDKGGPAE